MTDTEQPSQWAVELANDVFDEAFEADTAAILIQRAFAEREAELVAENAKLRDILSNLSSYLGAGMGGDKTTGEQFDARIRWGIDHIGRVYRDRAAQVVEECSKRPKATWGEVKRAIINDTCLESAAALKSREAGHG